MRYKIGSYTMLKKETYKVEIHFENVLDIFHRICGISYEYMLPLHNSLKTPLYLRLVHISGPQTMHVV